jgi:hypothetical protein
MPQLPPASQYVITARLMQDRSFGSQRLQESPHFFPAHGTYGASQTGRNPTQLSDASQYLMLAVS